MTDEDEDVEDRDEDEDDDDDENDVGDVDDDDDGQVDDDAGGRDRPSRGWGGPVNTAGGFVLALLFWAWIGLPFLQGGPTKVKAVLRAKFMNQAPDGSFLP